MLRSASILALFVATTSCAYGYAGQEGKKRSTEKEINPNVKVVEIKEDDDENEATKAEEPTEQKTPAADESPCGADTFDIFFFSASARQAKTIDCATREARGDDTSMPDSAYQSAERAGLPEGTWFMLVDPKGEHSEHLDNDQLLRISRRFSIEYFGRDRDSGLLVYTFDEEL